MIVKTGDGKEQDIELAVAKDSAPVAAGVRRTGGPAEQPGRSEYDVLSDIVYDGERHFLGKDGARVPLMSASRGAVVLLSDKDARALLARGAVKKKG